jgi:hypothetical protein
MGEENRVENQDQKGYRSTWEMLQGPVRGTVWDRSLADLEAPDGFLAVPPPAVGLSVRWQT